MKLPIETAASLDLSEPGVLEGIEELEESIGLLPHRQSREFFELGLDPETVAKDAIEYQERGN